MSRRMGVILLFAIATSCSEPALHHNWEDYKGPERERFLAPETALPQLSDPAEPFNRSMSAVNHGLIWAIVQPLSTGWGWITGGPVRESFRKFFHNLRWPLHLFGNLLQAQWHGSWRVTERFFINTTVGILGFFDPALGWGIEPSDEDFGRVFSRWGWEHSNYLVLPFFGPKTSREACALPFDLVLNITTYLPGGSTVETVNTGTDKLDTYFRFIASQYDPYHRGRILYLLNREWRNDTYDAIPARDRSVETLGAIYLSNHDVDFPDEAETREVAIPESGKNLPYDLWLQPGPAPLVCILPGLGGHRVSSSTYGLAEMAWRAGYSAVTISNAMNWEFIQKGASVDVPGYAVQDAADVHRALGRILADIENVYPKRVTRKALLGISLGAFHTLLIAAREGDADYADKKAYPVFDAYAALNPPVRFRVGLERLDAFFNAPLALPANEQRPWVDGLIGKVVNLVQKGTLEPGNLLPFDKMEAEFLIGAAFRGSLDEIILSSQDRKDLGVLKTPRSGSRSAKAWLEACEYSYREYLLAFAFPYYQKRNPELTTVDDMLDRCDLHLYGAALKANSHLFVFTNINDFLIEPDDLAWLRETFGGDRLLVESEGSHLGNLYKEEVQKKITEKLQSILHWTTESVKGSGDWGAKGKSLP